MEKDSSRKNSENTDTKLSEAVSKGEKMAKRDSKTGRFMPNANRWVEKDGLAYCYSEEELLFFTDIKTSMQFRSKSIGKMANGYAETWIGGRAKPIHRIIMNAKEGDIIDHINRNKKDNRLENLRKTDKSENAYNSKLRSNNKSGTTGVRFRKDTKRWSAEIKKDYKKIPLGCFATKEEAIQARKEAEVKYYGYQLTN